MKGHRHLKIKKNLNRTDKFLYNTFFAASYQIVLLLVGFITPRIMLQYYGSEINGLITSITQFITYFNLVEAGLAGAAVYALYKPLADNDYREISAIVVATKRFYMISGYAFLTLVMGLALMYPMIVKVSGLGYWQVFLLVLILGFSGVLEFFTLGKYRALLTADQKLYVISISSILYIISNTIILMGMAIPQINIVIVKAVALSSILLRCLVLYLYSKRNYTYVDYKVPPNNQALNKRWDALYLQILGAVHTGAPVIIATIFTDLKTVSIYSVYNMIIGGIAGILGIFTNGLSSSFGDIIAKKQTEILQKTYQEFEFAYYSLITLIYSVSFVMIMSFIGLYTTGITDVNYYEPYLGMLFILNALLYNLKTPQGMLVMSAGHYKETKLQTTIQGTIAVVGGIILAPKFGLAGILWGSIFSNLYRDIDLFFYIPKNITKLSVIKTLKKVLCSFVEILIICLPFLHFKVVCDTYFQWVGNAIIIVIYGCLVILIVGGICNQKEITGIWKRIKEMRKRRHGAV